jgi:hypothetical protein
MSPAVFGGAGELHRFFAAGVTISPTIVVVAIPIRVPITIAIRISIMIPIPVPVAIAIRIPIMIPIAPVMISVATSVFIVATETIIVAVAALGNLRSIHQKVCAASAINPNSLLIESPGLTLSAGRLTMLSL